MKDYYKILQVPHYASKAEIKKAYKKLALKWHPDRNPNKVVECTKQFLLISEAYKALSEEKRKLNKLNPLFNIKKRKMEDLIHELHRTRGHRDMRSGHTATKRHKPRMSRHMDPKSLWPNLLYIYMVYANRNNKIDPETKL